MHGVGQITEALSTVGSLRKSGHERTLRTTKGKPAPHPLWAQMRFSSNSCTVCRERVSFSFHLPSPTLLRFFFFSFFFFSTH